METFLQRINRNSLSKFSFLLKYILYLRLNLNLIMEKGTVKFFNESKGYGFVVSSKDESEYFVHVSKLIDEVKEGDNVEFELEEGR